MSNYNDAAIAVAAMFHYKKRAGNTFGEVPGPEHTEEDSFDMSLHSDATSLPFAQYAPETIYGPVTGSVYFITIGEPYPTHVKIGFTRGNPRQRLKDLQTGCPFPLSMHGHVPGCMDMEAELHRVLHEYRCMGEWFAFDGYAELVVDGILTHHEGGVPA